ncbi:MAG: hypothetical protein Q4C84_16100 [Bacillota bacterium]|nr:hypothetical protein [Bacillota bacterium]
MTKQTRMKALRKHEKLLEKIEEDRVFSIFQRDGVFYIAEECDMCFSHGLTKAECLELSELFKEIAEECEER